MNGGCQYFFLPIDFSAIQSKLSFSATVHAYLSTYLSFFVFLSFFLSFSLCSVFPSGNAILSIFFFFSLFVDQFHDLMSVIQQGLTCQTLGAKDDTISNRDEGKKSSHALEDC